MTGGIRSIGDRIGMAWLAQFGLCIALFFFGEATSRARAHGARNYHRLALLYLLLEGVMTDLFMLIAQDGILAKLQYISFGYNVSGVLLILFEILESMNWMTERMRCLIKRLLFNYETSLMGEFLVAGLLEYYLTALNRSTFKGSAPVAEAVSHYVWSLVGHGAIVLGVAAVILSVRILGTCVFVWWKHRSWALFVAPCSVDTILGSRSRMVLLRGYSWRDEKLCYTTQTLKAFGMLHLLSPTDRKFLVLQKLYWFTIPKNDLVAIGELFGEEAGPCHEHLHEGILTLFDRELGGPVVEGPSSEPLTVARGGDSNDYAGINEKSGV